MLSRIVVMGARSKLRLAYFLGITALRPRARAVATTWERQRQYDDVRVSSSTRMPLPSQSEKGQGGATDYAAGRMLADAFVFRPRVIMRRAGGRGTAGTRPGRSAGCQRGRRWDP